MTQTEGSTRQMSFQKGAEECVTRPELEGFQLLANLLNIEISRLYFLFAPKYVIEKAT